MEWMAFGLGMAAGIALAGWLQGIAAGRRRGKAAPQAVPQDRLPAAQSAAGRPAGWGDALDEQWRALFAYAGMSDAGLDEKKEEEEAS